MNVEKLIGEVAKRHKMLLPASDPAFALLTMSELILADYLELCKAAVEHAQEQTVAGTKEQVDRARQTVSRLVTDAGQYAADSIKRASDTARSELARDLRAEREKMEDIANRAVDAANWTWWAVVAAVVVIFGTVFYMLRNWPSGGLHG